MKKRIITTTLAAAIALSTLGVACGDKETKIDASKAPDYSQKTEQYVMYGYHCPVPAAAYYNSDGSLAFEMIDPATGKHVDFRTVERYKEYLDCGLNTLFLQSNDGYPQSGVPYAETNLAKNFHIAREAGIDKVILTDTRLHTWLCNTREPVIGEATTKTQIALFEKIYGNAEGEKTLDDLVQVVKGWLKEYIFEPNFYGVMLWDEPAWYFVPQVATAYKAIKLAFPLAKAELEAEGKTVACEEIFVQTNLLPAYGYNGDESLLVDGSDPENANLTRKEAFQKYVKTYIDISGATDITMDSYPIRQSGRGEYAEYTIDSSHFMALQTFAELTKGKNMSMGGLSCTSENTDPSGQTIKLKGPTKSDMYYQLNSYMMFGFDSYSYYTYWAKTSGADVHTDGTSFINRDGTRGVLYDIMKDIHAEMQAMAPTLRQFEYNAAGYVICEGALSYDCSYINEMEDAAEQEFALLEGVTVGNDQVGMLTELYDDEKEQYMYALMNTQAPGNGNHSHVGLNAVMEFKDCNAVKMLYQGKEYIVALEDGKLNVNLSAGAAVYVMPFNG